MQEPVAPEFPPPTGRRASDQQNERILADILKLNMEIRDRVMALESMHKHQSEAFVKDDLGHPDYHGHRKAHLQMMKEAEVVSGYKQEVTKKVLVVIVTALLTLLAAGFAEAIRK